MTRIEQVFLAVLCCLFFTTSDFVVAQPPARSGYDVAWYDEFDGNSLDSALWTVANTNVTTNFSLQDYLPSQVSVSGGSLRILSENIPSRGRAYRSGLVTSTALQKEGRWDVRAKLPATKGMWPAIWLLSDTATAPWPSQGEIDIMENRGDEPNETSAAFHYGENGNGVYRHEFVYRGQTSVHDGTLQNYHNGFHVYSVEWDSDQLRFYVDDVHHWTVRDHNVENFISTEAGAMRLILNTAIGGLFLDNPDGSTVWPQVFEIDYVHAYTKSASGTTLTFENGGFEDNGGSLAGWSKFGDSINNVSSGNERVGNGAEALKLYGQFNGGDNYSGVTQGITVVAGDELTATASAFVAANDSIAGSSNFVALVIDYFSEQHGEFGSPQYLGADSVTLANGNSVNNQWLTQQLNSTAPAGAVEARVGIVYGQSNNAGGAVYVDDVNFSIDAPPVLLGDVDLSGDVNFLDISPFIAVLSSGGFQAEADCNQDEEVNFLDISPFIAVLSNN
jgi:beta-glucanase (GH16 family)